MTAERFKINLLFSRPLTRKRDSRNICVYGIFQNVCYKRTIVEMFPQSVQYIFIYPLAYVRRYCTSMWSIPPIYSDTAPPLYTHPCTRFALLNTFTCVRTRAISVNYLLILIDDSNVLTVYYITVFLLAYAFALCRSAARSTGRNVGNLIWRVIQFELDRKCFSVLVG